MQRLSIINTTGGHRLYDDPNGDLVKFIEAKKAISDIRTSNREIVRDLYNQVSELSKMIESVVVRQAD